MIKYIFAMLGWWFPFVFLGWALIYSANRVIESELYARQELRDMCDYVHIEHPDYKC